MGKPFSLVIMAGWWFGTWLLVGNGKIIPTDEVHHFSEGLKPPTR